MRTFVHYVLFIFSFQKFKFPRKMGFKIISIVVRFMKKIHFFFFRYGWLYLNSLNLSLKNKLKNKKKHVLTIASVGKVGFQRTFELLRPLFQKKFFQQLSLTNSVIYSIGRYNSSEIKRFSRQYANNNNNTDYYYHYKVFEVIYNIKFVYYHLK